MPSRTFTAPHRIDLRVTLSPLAADRYDPTVELGSDRLARAWHTPQGAATLTLRQLGEVFEAEAWGPGAGWALDQAPALVGCDDARVGFAPEHPLVARAHRRRPGLRMARSGLIYDLLVPTILAQKVTGLEAVRAWRGIVRTWGAPAPGPIEGLRLPPPPQVLADQPYWAFHRLGVERKRAVIIIDACRRIRRLEEAVAMDRDAAFRRLTALPGLGPWTANLLLRTACGDPDAVEVGDYHVPNHVAWNLAGEVRGDDGRMLELLAPFAGHRGRVVRLLLLEGQRAPAFGPRLAPHGVERL